MNFCQSTEILADRVRFDIIGKTESGHQLRVWTDGPQRQLGGYVVGFQRPFVPERQLTRNEKDAGLRAIADALDARTPEIVAANACAASPPSAITTGSVLPCSPGSLWVGKPSRPERRFGTTGTPFPRCSR